MARPVQLLLLCLGCARALRVGGWTRREMMGAASLAIGLTALRPPALAQEILLLTDEELRERTRQKLEKAQQSRGGDAPLDYNPEAGVNLRAKTIEQNLKESLAKQAELKKRDTKQKREDLCEMLGRGC